MPDPLPDGTLSIVVIAQDEERDIRTCISSAQFADEVIVVDGGSVDRTVEIASAYEGVTVIERPWDGYSSQWNFAIGAAKGDWIMTLSADEVITAELSQELRGVINSGRYDALRVSFQFYVFGQPLRFGLFQLHRELRCVRRGSLIGMSDDLVHEHLLAVPQARRHDLKGKLVHRTYASRAEYMQKADRYIELEAVELAEAIRERGIHVMPFSFREIARAIFSSWGAGRNFRERLRPLKNSRPSYLTWLAGPLARFVIDYVVCLGFLDGRTGFFLARSGGQYTYRRYAEAQALLRGRRRE
jgi:glycosyltransferase involved in cell wall biosynthesis